VNNRLAQARGVEVQGGNTDKFDEKTARMKAYGEAYEETLRHLGIPRRIFRKN